MPRPIHFEIHAGDPERARAFYSGLFGWSFTHVPTMDYYLIQTGPEEKPGIDGGLVRRASRNPDSNDPAPVSGFVCTHDVDDVDAYVARALSLGGAVARPKAPVPGVGWLAYVKDTEANIFGMLQHDPSASAP